MNPENVKIEKFLCFQYRIYHLEETLRIVYGFHLAELGHSYQLQQLKPTIFGDMWFKKAWTYGSVTNTFDMMKDYLLERFRQDEEANKPLF